MNPSLENTDQSKPLVVLIVDDEPTSIAMLEGLLEHEGYQTMCAASGEEALSIAEIVQPNIILLDVNLPDVMGPQVCQRLKKNPVTAEIPVLFLSVESSVHSKMDCFDAGGQDYITKPYEPREVLARVRTHLRLQQTQRMMVHMLSSKIALISEAQKALLPLDPSEMPNARFYGICKQLTEAGGDFFHVVKVGEDVYDYVTADVSGHDIGNALVTSALKTLLVQHCSLLQTPIENLTIINKVIRSVLQPGQFVGLGWVRINRLRGRAIIVNAGQPPVIIVPRNGLGIRRIDLAGDIVGIFDTVAFEQCEIDVAPGDRLLMYSDGIVECDGKSPQSREAGIDRLTRLAALKVKLSLRDFVEGLVEEMLSDRLPEDDILSLGVDI